MKVRLKLKHWLPRVLGVDGITLYPYVMIRVENPGQRLVAHELVHVDQVRAIGWLRFYGSYLMFYFAARVKGTPKDLAYSGIPYEIEARMHENNYVMLERAEELMGE